MFGTVPRMGCERAAASMRHQRGAVAVSLLVAMFFMAITLIVEASQAFDPCPATGACKILPLGDSITEAQVGGYRVELFRQAVLAGRQITFVGSSANGPSEVAGQPFPRNHEGHSGWTISQLDNVLPSPVLNVQPHIILLHIGTNDIWQMPSGAPQRLATLLDQILEAAPNALLAVAKVIPFPLWADRVTIYNNELVRIVEDRIRAGKHVILVDQFTGFPLSELLGDATHPTDAGYARMGGVWFTAISSYLHVSGSVPVLPPPSNLRIIR